MLPQQIQNRFNKNIIKTDNGCWLWNGYKNKDGYGRFFYNHKHYMAHRIAWEIAGNIIPENHIIRHKCRNKCVNPEHLETGTNWDNSQDKKRDGTEYDKSGENNPNCKLSAEQIQQLKLEYQNRKLSPTKITQQTLADKFGISKSHCWGILNGWYR